MFSYRNPSLDPPDGWRFDHEETGMKVYASSAENLRIKTTAFLKTNNFPVPIDLRQVIARQTCARAPEFCLSTEPPSLADKAREFTAAMRNWVRYRMPVVSQEVFEERQRICEGCELYGGVRTFGFIGCGKCGCTGLKLWLASEKCPLPGPRWKATV